MSVNPIISVEGKILPVQFRRNAQARRIVMRLSKDGSTVQLTLPKRCSEKKAIAFANTQTEWLAKQIAKKPKLVPFTSGIELAILDEPLTFKHHDKRSNERQDSTVYIGGDSEFFARRMKDYIKTYVRDEFSEIACVMAAQLGVHLAGLRLTDTVSRWGSCSTARRINLSWRLAMAPKQVARYVIAHEVAHLVHFDHSPEFWEVVEELHLSYKQDKAWLRKYGSRLHAYT